MLGLGGGAHDVRQWYDHQECSQQSESAPAEERGVSHRSRTPPRWAFRGAAGGHVGQLLALLVSHYAASSFGGDAVALDAALLARDVLGHPYGPMHTGRRSPVRRPLVVQVRVLMAEIGGGLADWARLPGIGAGLSSGQRG